MDPLEPRDTQLARQTRECVAPDVLGIADMNADIISVGFDVVHFGHGYEIKSMRPLGDEPELPATATFLGRIKLLGEDNGLVRVLTHDSIIGLHA